MLTRRRCAFLLLHLRQLSAAAPSSLKDVLRKLYLRVHPDLFADAPAEQAVNSASFALLQRWLEAARATAEPSGRAQRFDFTFWLRGDAGLHRVALSLPPPGRRAHGQDEHGFAPTATLLLFTS